MAAGGGAARMVRLEIKPQLRFSLSRYLFMQFMEPLGNTDPSVEAAWDFENHRWRPEVIEVIKDLSPTCIRWGGIYTSYWRWREGIGPRSNRVPAVNYQWGGMYTNQVGLHEFLDLCSQVNADPLIGVNFAADGRPRYRARAGGPEEAADLVAYCNDPTHAERRSNGQDQPWGVKLWQIGNETSYPPPGERMTCRENALQFRTFATAMRRRDPGIELIGWGDMDIGGQGESWWADELIDVAGDLLNYVGIHMMQQRPRRSDSILRGFDYTEDRNRAWAELLEIYQTLEPRLLAIEELLDRKNTPAGIAITEGHLSLRPRNACPILYEWIAGLYHAKVLNLYQRHGERVRMATIADFFGNRWTVNAIMIGGPSQTPFLMPAGIVAGLYRKHIGDYAVDVAQSSPILDVAASRTGDTIYLHVINDQLKQDQSAELSVCGLPITEFTAWQIAPDSLATYVDYDRPEALRPTKIQADCLGNGVVSMTFPAASVTVCELRVGSKGGE